MEPLVQTLIVALIITTLIYGWSYLGSLTGLASFGQALFFGFGAYAVAVSNVRGGSPWYGALGGALFAVIVALVGAGWTLRGRGLLFALVTLLGSVAAGRYIAAQTWLGPGNAYTFVPRPGAFGGFFTLQFAAAWPYALLGFGVAGAVAGIGLALARTPVGLLLRAIRANPVLARSLGARIVPPRLLALAASAFVSSVAGSLFAVYRQVTDPAVVFAPSLSIDVALLGALVAGAPLVRAPLAALVYAAVITRVSIHPPGLLGTALLAVEAFIALSLVERRAGGTAASRTPGAIAAPAGAGA